MRWGSHELRPDQRVLVQEALDYSSGHAEGLPPGLFSRLHAMLDSGAIRTRRMRVRARYIALPLVSPWIELEPETLGMVTIYQWQRALAACQGEDACERQRELIMAKAEQSWLFVGAALVHEGAHALSGRSASRQHDEKSAYGAERHFLRNVLSSNPALLVANAARSLLADAERDGWQLEGV